jgi:MarR family transcriptional regulator, organic hydroperoxide resistance regulator
MKMLSQKPSRQFDSRFASAAESPGFLLWKVSNLHQRVQRRALADVGLTPIQFSVLACYQFLSMQAPVVTQSHVSTHAGIDKMFVSDVTKALVKHGCLAKQKQANDGRSYSVQVTEKGAALCNQALKVVEAVDVAFFSQAKHPKQLLAALQQLSSRTKNALSAPLKTRRLRHHDAVRG